MRGQPDENEERAQRMVDAVELAEDEPRDLPQTRERAPSKRYGEIKPRKPLLWPAFQRRSK